jgi:hypothetical protein
MNERVKRITRRQMLTAGTLTAGALTSLTVGADSALAHHTQISATDSWLSGGGLLPVKEIEKIMQIPGTVSEGILDIHIERKDLNVTLRIPGSGEIPFEAAWENNGDLFFQPLGNGQAILNGDFGGLLPSEIDPFIDKLLEGGIVFQALHQHFYDMNPQVYFIHFRGVGDPLQLARAVSAAMKVTGTPLPQSSPSHPTTSLPAEELGRIIGVPATVGSSGVVSMNVLRRNAITLDEVPVSPFLNIATSVAFEPLSNDLTAVASDFSMIASEVQNVVRVMRQQGWVTGCLYTQETNEQPQLYFSHQVKVGNAIELAREIRRGLDQTNSEGSPSYK